uniref:Uncharacterized protein n=1 Tax=Panagrolaimus sp. JU765 TaxID=591449 RepID=A0AC34QZ02_9BILA
MRQRRKNNYFCRVNGQSRIPWAQCKQMVANLLVEYFWKKGNLTSHLQHARATPPNSSSLAHTSPFDFLMKCPSSCFRNFAFNDFKLPQLLFDETILRNFNLLLLPLRNAAVIIPLVAAPASYCHHQPPIVPVPASIVAAAAVLFRIHPSFI